MGSRGTFMGVDSSAREIPLLNIVLFYQHGDDRISSHFAAISILCSTLFENKHKHQKEEKPENAVFSGLFNGADGRIRTGDLILTNYNITFHNLF